MLLQLYLIVVIYLYQYYMKKILFLIPNLGHGGAERVLVNMANNLDKKKYDITIHSLFNEGINKKNIDFENVNYKYSFNFKMFRGYTKILKLFTPNLLYKLLIKDTYDITVSYLEGVTARIISADCNKTKKYGWIHIEQDNEKIFAHSFRTLNEAINCYKKFNQIICVSNTVKNDFIKLSGIKENVNVLYNINESSQIIEKGEEIIQDISFDNNIINICSVAKLMKTKGFDRLIKVHRKLLDDGLMHRIYIFGIGEEKENLKSLIEENNVASTFILAGFKENPYKYIKQCDLYVCSSRREGFSTAVTEALILGVPVLSTNCSGAKELLGQDNEYGIVVENSENGLYIGLKKMLSTLDIIKEYKIKAVERGKYFSKDRRIKEVEDLFDM